MTRAGALAAAALAAWSLGVFAPAAAAAEATPAARSTGESSPRGPFLSVEVAPGPFTVGDRIEVELLLSVPTDELTGEPRFPEWDGAWGEAEVIAAGEVGRVEDAAAESDAPTADDREAGGETAAGAAGAGGRTLFRQRLELAAFRPGDIPLPPVGVTVPTAEGEVVLETAELALAIDSVLPPAAEDAPEPEPMPPAPPRPLPPGERFWWTLAAGTAACFLALFWARARRRRAVAAAGPPPPPFEELRSALDAARRAESPAAGHAAVSLAFRRWLGRTLSFPAAESSTAEIRRELSRRHLPEGAARRAVALLAGCDLVKFARREATADQLAERADAALGLATEIEDFHRPAPAEAATAGPGEAAA